MSPIPDVDALLARDREAAAAVERQHAQAAAQAQAIEDAAEEDARQRAQKALREQDRRHAIFTSPSRFMADYERAQRRRMLLDAPVASLLAQRAVAVREAREAAEAAVMEEYAAKITAVTEEFEATEALR